MGAVGRRGSPYRPSERIGNGTEIVVCARTKLSSLMEIDFDSHRFLLLFLKFMLLNINEIQSEGVLGS